MGSAIQELLRDEEGSQLVEFVLLTVLIAIASIAGITFLGGSSSNRMNNISTAIG